MALVFFYSNLLQDSLLRISKHLALFDRNKHAVTAQKIDIRQNFSDLSSSDFQRMCQIDVQEGIRKTAALCVAVLEVFKVLDRGIFAPPPPRQWWFETK